MIVAARAGSGRTRWSRSLHHASRPVVLFGTIFLVGSSLSVPTGAAVTPPGTQIVNVAAVEASVSSGLPPETSSSNPAVTPVAVAPALLEKQVMPSGTVRPGDSLRYTLVFENRSGQTLPNVVLTDPLDPFIADVADLTTGSIPDRGSGSGRVQVAAAYDSAAREVRWAIQAVPAGFRGEVSFRAILAPSIPDETILRNAFRFASDLDPNGALSPEVANAVVGPALLLTLAPSRDRIEVGDIVGFRLAVTNVSPALDLTGALVRLDLPVGFRYQPGSLRIAGRKAGDPRLGPGARRLEIPAGALAAGESAEIALVGVVGAGAHLGEAVAHGRASGVTPAGVPVESNRAEARLRIIEGILLGESVVAGKVFIDIDGDGRPSEAEPVVPGVRLLLEDGTQVLTDIAGKYHIEGLRPGVHTLKIDPETAPSGLRAARSGHRSSGSPGVQFLDVGPGELFKANFALRGDGDLNATLRAEIVPGPPATPASSPGRGRPATPDLSGPTATRPESGPPLAASVLFEQGSSTFRPDADGIVESYAQILREMGAPGRDLRVMESLSESPVLGRERAEAFERALAKALNVAAAAQRQARTGAAQVVRASGAGSGADPSGQVVPAVTGSRPASGAAEALASEDLLRSIPRGVHIVSPRDGAVIARERVDIEVAFPTGSPFRLFAAGREVPVGRVGVRMEAARSGMSLWRYIGVDLDEGENLIAAEAAPPGMPSQRVEIRVDRVGLPARILIRGAGHQPADGRTPGRLAFEVRDARGNAVLDGTLVTVEAEGGSILGQDADPRGDGFQVRTSSGGASVRLSPASAAETRSVRVTAGKVTEEAEIRFGPHIRDWIVAGIGQADWSGGGGTPTESDLSGDADASARLAFFAKGRVGERSLLSVSYDSSRERDEEALFRTVDPMKLFPVYGDASAQSYDLQSQGKLAVRWERERSYLMYGDFRTGLAAAELARYDRALSGGLAHIENPRVTVHAFGATTPQRGTRDSFPGQGSSGPYRLSSRPIVAYSERVMIEVRDRFHTERIVSSSPQSRFTDYDIDYNAGTILFRSTVPAQDERFNPVAIVVTYETVDVSGESLVAGGRIGWRPSARFEWGTTAVREDREDVPLTLSGMDFTLRPWAGAAITTEYARISEPGRRSGAFSIRFTAAAGPRLSYGFYVRDVPADFTNPSMTGVSEIGTHKEGIELRTVFPDGSKVTAETFRQDSLVTATDRRVTAVGWERAEGPLTWSAGGSALGGALEGGGRGSSGILRAGLAARLAKRFDASLSRQEVVAGETVTGYPTRTEMGAGYRFSEKVRGFLRHELDQGEIGDRQRSLVGVEGALDENTTVESRYAMEDALNGSRGYAILGARTRFSIAEYWSADLRAERAETVVGYGGSDFTSLSAGAEYLPGKSKFTSRYEVRFGELETRHLLTTAGALKLTRDLVFYARQRTGLSAAEAPGGDRLDGDGIIGLAYRPVTTDRLNWLARIQATRGESLPGGGTTLAASPGARGILGVFELNVQPADRWHVLGRYAGRYARDLFEGYGQRLYTEVWEARCLADVGRRVTAGVTARLLRQAATGTALAGIGLETGYMVARDLWLVGGYNLTGFSDRRFPDGERRAEGPFISLRFKFDESLIAGLAGGEGGRETQFAGETPPAVRPAAAPASGGAGDDPRDR